MFIVKSLFFYCLLYLRGLFFILSGLLGFFALLGGVVALLIGNNAWMAAFCVGVSFGLFMLRQAYDAILIRLTP